MSTSRIPCSIAFLAAASAASPAAYGVLFREPLKPAAPELDHVSTFPSGSVMVTSVLLKLDWMYAQPAGTFFRSRRRTRPAPLLRSATPFPPGLLLRARLASASHGTTGSLSHPRVGARPLAVDRKIASVPQTAIAPNLHQPLDVEVHLATEVTLNLVLAVDDLAQPAYLVLGQVADPGVRTNVGPLQDLPGRAGTDTINGRQSGLNPPIARNVYTSDSSHFSSASLSLPLLMLRVVANHQDYAFAANDLAPLATCFDRCSYFHVFSPQLPAAQELAANQDRQRERWTIRPRERSNGDRANRTRSPGRIRPAPSRMLADTCATTWLPSPNSIRNKALGSASITVPSTSAASSAGIPRPERRRPNGPAAQTRSISHLSGGWWERVAQGSGHCFDRSIAIDLDQVASASVVFQDGDCLHEIHLQPPASRLLAVIHPLVQLSAAAVAYPLDRGRAVQRVVAGMAGPAQPSARESRQEGNLWHLDVDYAVDPAPLALQHLI